MHGKPADIGFRIKVIRIDHLKHARRYHFLYNFRYGAAKFKQPARNNYRAVVFYTHKLLRFQAGLILNIIITVFACRDDSLDGVRKLLSHCETHRA
jgi:hypothetical protein